MRPHSREKRVVDKKVEVTKKVIEGVASTAPTKKNSTFNIFRKIVKK